MIGNALAGGIAKQFPDKFTGSSSSPASTLRATLNWALGEHVYLAASATGAALGGRDAEFKAAADALDMNSVDLSKAVGSVYGTDAENAFLPLWRSHIGFFVDYTQGAAANNQAKKDKAVADLTGYSQDFAAFISGANPNLSKDAVANLLNTHVGGLAGAVDAQAAGDAPRAFTELRASYMHMQMIGDALAAAIVQQFPDKFGEAAAAPEAMVMPNTGIETGVSTWVLALAVLLVAAGTFLVSRSRRAVRNR
jgi:LPXTG-motif cell wall-anchored protein